MEGVTVSEGVFDYVDGEVKGMRKKAIITKINGVIDGHLIKSPGNQSIA